MKNKQIAEHYNAACKAYGDIGWKASLWSSEEEQIKSFQAIAQVVLPGFIPKKQKIEILDVGCGQGDFYKFAKSIFGEITYTGIDFSPEMIKIARSKYPEAKFEIKDLNSVNKEYDFIVGSGLFNINTESHIDYVKSSIVSLFNKAKIGISFSMLSKGLWEEEVNELYYFDAKEIINWSFGLTNFIKFDQANVPGHFILNLYKEN